MVSIFANLLEQRKEKKFNSHRTGLEHQHGRRFIVLELQYGRRDVMWKRSIELGLNLPERNTVVGLSVGSAVVGTVVGLAVVSGFGQQHLVFLFQQENLSQHPSVPGGQGLPILIHLAPSLSLTQELRMPVKVNW